MIRRWLMHWLSPHYHGPTAKEIEMAARLNVLEEQLAKDHALICVLANEIKALKLEMRK